MSNPLEIDQALLDKMAADPHRPKYHFLPPANWLNDPNGPIFWKGVYHLFYQYTTLDGGPGPKHWGHASSTDLVHWTHHPLALSPTPGGPDKDGVWTGCAVDNGGVATAVYTGVRPQVQCIATSKDDDLTEWEKYIGNPVVSDEPRGMNLTGFRDPCVWKEDDAWLMLIGSGIEGAGGTALLYTSPDLIHWKYLHPLFVGDRDKNGRNWECPDFFPLGDKHVLVVSPHGTTRYFIGRYQDYRFAPEQEGLFDLSFLYYAPKSFLDGQGRRIMWGWLREARTQEAYVAAGWSGAMSLPRELTLASDGSLRVRPVPELQVLRGQSQCVTDLEVSPDAPGRFDGIEGDGLEIMAEIEPGDAHRVGISVRGTPDDAEQTRVFYNAADGRLGINQEKSSLSSDGEHEIKEGPFRLEEGETLKLHIFLDRSVIEVFANDRACVTGRVYPTREDSLQVGTFARGGKGVLKSLEAWPVESIW